MSDLILPPEKPDPNVPREVAHEVTPMNNLQWAEYKKGWPGNCTIADMQKLCATIETLWILIEALRKDAYSFSPANDFAVPYQRMIHLMLKKQLTTGGKVFLPWEFVHGGADAEKEQLNVSFREDGLLISIGIKGGKVIIAAPNEFNAHPPKNGRHR